MERNIKKSPFVVPFSETNILPTMAKFSNPETGVQSRLAPDQSTPPNFNNLTTEEVEEFAAIRKASKLDAFALTSQQLDKRAKAYSKSALHTAFAERVVNQRFAKQK